MCVKSVSASPSCNNGITLLYVISATQHAYFVYMHPISSSTVGTEPGWCSGLISDLRRAGVHACHSCQASAQRAWKVVGIFFGKEKKNAPNSLADVIRQPK